jgi:branched-chain amino acid transport system permease protein
VTPPSGSSSRGTRIALLAITAAALLALPFLSPAAWTMRATLVSIASIGVLGQNLLIGNAGLASFGQAGFLAVGAFTFAHLRHAGVPAFAAIAAAGLLAAGAGAALGFPALRLKGPYLAVATLGFALAVHRLLSASERLSGGRTGMDVPRIEPALGLTREATAYFVCLLAAVLFTAATRNLVSSWVGRTFAALRDADSAAEAAGIDLARARLLAFALSSFYTGVHGALAAQLLGHADVQSFTVNESITLLVAVVVGGLGSVAGSLFGAAFVVLVPALSGGAGHLVPVAFGVAIVVVLLFEPLGLAGGWAKARLYLETRVLR